MIFDTTREGESEGVTIGRSERLKAILAGDRVERSAARIVGEPVAGAIGSGGSAGAGPQESCAKPEVERKARLGVERTVRARKSED